MQEKGNVVTDVMFKERLQVSSMQSEQSLPVLMSMAAVYSVVHLGRRYNF